MYGLVNRAIQDMVTSRFGDEKWEQIREGAGIEDEIFYAHAVYPDELTYRLVHTSAEILGLSDDAMLVALGEHWVLETARRSYGAMLQACGEDLQEFLKNLPQFHTRVMMMYPKLQPPRFESIELSKTSLHLRYFSDRPGMSSFVIGIVQGLGKMYGSPVKIRHVEKKSEFLNHDLFHVEWDETP